MKPSRKKHNEETLKWFNDNIEIMRNKYPEILDRIESMDRSQLVAECCRLHFTTRDYLKTIIHLKQKEKGNKCQVVQEDTH